MVYVEIYYSDSRWSQQSSTSGLQVASVFAHSRIAHGHSTVVLASICLWRIRYAAWKQGNPKEPRHSPQPQQQYWEDRTRKTSFQVASSAQSEARSYDSEEREAYICVWKGQAPRAIAVSEKYEKRSTFLPKRASMMARGTSYYESSLIFIVRRMKKLLHEKIYSMDRRPMKHFTL